MLALLVGCGRVGARVVFVGGEFLVQGVEVSLEIWFDLFETDLTDELAVLFESLTVGVEGMGVTTEKLGVNLSHTVFLSRRLLSQPRCRSHLLLLLLLFLPPLQGRPLNTTERSLSRRIRIQRARLAKI